MRRLLSILTAAVLTVVPAMSASTFVIEQPEGDITISEYRESMSEQAWLTFERLKVAVKHSDFGPLGEMVLMNRTRVSPDLVTDTRAYLQQQSVDGEGLEVIAIIANILEARFAAFADRDGKMVYVWPYLAVHPLLGRDYSPLVLDGMRVAGGQKMLEMVESGRWTYWQVRIDEDGRLTVLGQGF